MNNSTKKRQIIIISILLGFMLTVWIVYALVNSGRPTVIINTSPMRADITIGDKTYRDMESGSEYTLGNKQVNIVVHRDGFLDNTYTYEVGDDRDDNIINIALRPETFEAQELLKSANEAAHRELIVTDSYQDLVDTVMNKNPILSDLPYYGSYFTMSQGLSVKNPDDPESFAIYVDIYDQFSQQGRDEAANFLRSKGYDPDDYEVIYRVEEYQVRSD